jgi:hypothetical protein
MGNDWLGYIFVFAAVAFVMMRLDLLGKQFEAVGARIRADVARTEEDRQEILDEWKQTQKEAAKDARHFWIFWFIVAFAAGMWTWHIGPALR